MKPEHVRMSRTFVGGQAFLPGNLIIRRMPPGYKPGDPIDPAVWARQPIRSGLLKHTDDV